MGTIHKGKAVPERFIHPYYDTWDADPIWQVAIDAPYPAATFRAVPLPGLGEPQTTIVRFHLKSVLGKQFMTSIRSLWATYPQTLAVNLGDYSLPAVVARVDKDLKIAKITIGINSWSAAYYRGLDANVPAIEYLQAACLERLGENRGTR